MQFDFRIDADTLCVLTKHAAFFDISVCLLAVASFFIVPIQLLFTPWPQVCCETRGMVLYWKLEISWACRDQKVK